MITKFNKYKLITENPDTIEHEDYDTLTFLNDETKPFFVDVNNDHTLVKNIYIGKFRDCHGDITNDYPGRCVGAYPGRLWLTHKIMSFWIYPNVKLFKDIINKLEENLKIKMFNNGWKIEIIKGYSGEIKMSDFNPNLSSDEEPYFRNDDDFYQGGIGMIPIEQYSGSEDVPEEKQIQHLMNWKEKELAKKIGKFHFGSFGSKLTAWDQPHNIKWRQAIRTSENKKN